MITSDKKMDPSNIYAEVFLIWESESRYVLDTLSNWIESSGKPCLLVHIFLRKDTPEKDRPKQAPWLVVHETLTSTHSASRTALMSFILKNYYQVEGVSAESLPKENPFSRLKVKFQKSLYFVQEYEAQYEELMSLLRGSSQFQKKYKVEVVTRQASAINDLLQKIEVLRDNIEDSQKELNSRRCVSCSLEVGNTQPRQGRRGSYYTCGHEVQDLDTSPKVQENRLKMLNTEGQSVSVPQIYAGMLQSNGQQVEQCQNCTPKRYSFVPVSLIPQPANCTCRLGVNELKGRRSVSPYPYCQDCNGREDADDSLYCQHCMGSLMRHRGQNKKNSQNELDSGENELKFEEGPCPDCYNDQIKNATPSPNRESPRSDSGAVSEEQSPRESPASSLDLSKEDDPPIESPRRASLFPKGSQKFYCKFCPQKEFSSQSVFEVHLRNCHKRCNCGCNQIFENRNEYLHHFYQIFPLGCFVVRKCPERFRSLYYQALHHKDAHFSEKPFYCVPCFRESATDSTRQKLAFKDMKSLRIHGEIVGHTDQEMFLIAKNAADREQNQPKLTLRSTAINFSG